MADVVLKCSGCGAFEWNLANEGLPHQEDTPEERERTQAKGYALCLGQWRNTGRSYAEFNPADGTVQGRYSATVFGEAVPFAYSDFEERIRQSAERKLASLQPHQYVIVADRREHKTVVRLEAPAQRSSRKE